MPALSTSVEQLPEPTDVEALSWDSAFHVRVVGRGAGLDMIAAIFATAVSLRFILSSLCYGTRDKFASAGEAS